MFCRVFISYKSDGQTWTLLRQFISTKQLAASGQTLEGLYRLVNLNETTDLRVFREQV